MIEVARRVSAVQRLDFLRLRFTGEPASQLGVLRNSSGGRPPSGPGDDGLDERTAHDWLAQWWHRYADYNPSFLELLRTVW